MVIHVLYIRVPNVDTELGDRTQNGRESESDRECEGGEETT